jgi:hypothetical protein
MTSKNKEKPQDVPLQAKPPAPRASDEYRVVSLGGKRLSINTNQRHGVSVGPRESVDLSPGEESSPEVQGLVNSRQIKLVRK